MNRDRTENKLDWVLVFAPFRKDAEYIEALLFEQNVGVVSAKADDDLEALLTSSPGIIVVTHEALTESVITLIAIHLKGQPDWSEMPIIILLEKAAPLQRIRDRLQLEWPASRLLFHTRPITPLELANAIQSNLLVRLRQRQVRDSIERERELRLELNHRVKNILASVTSIFQMTRRDAKSVDDLAMDFGARLQALSSFHTAVYEVGGEEVSLSSVVALTVSPYNATGYSRIKVSGPDLFLSRNAGMTIALCLHELMTNAIKYGSLSVPKGKVSIEWKVVDGSKTVFTIDWFETDGPMVEPPTRRGYGTRYVRSALGSLLGSTPEMIFRPEGFHCRAVGPVWRLKSVH